MNYYEDIFKYRPYLASLDLSSVTFPAYIIDTEALQRNLEILQSVQDRSGAKILLALKAFAHFSTFDLIKKYLHGCCVSSPYEARLAREEFGGEVHSFAPAYTQVDMDEHLALSDHILFNSFSQYQKFSSQIKESSRQIEVGLRVNPLHSETEIELYNPCASGSRLGVLPSEFEGRDLSGVDGLHFHTLCQKGADALARTATAFEDHFGDYLKDLKWINFGGGHHLTQPDYDIDLLCQTISYFKNKYDVEVYLEPGEAVVVNTGSLLASVVDIVENDGAIAILDISATCHMPDVLEMPYRPEIRGAGQAGEKAYTYRLGGLTCLAGDVIGDYSFDFPLVPGSQILLDDMSHYTTVKTTFFNGIRHPAIMTYDSMNNKLQCIREFTYEDYRNKL
jgi:carboxynorspermidine decarboxylase